MPQDSERIAKLEANDDTRERNIHELWENVNALNQFRYELEGSMRMMKFLLGFVGISNAAMLLKVFLQH